VVDKLSFCSAIVRAVSDNHGSDFGLRALVSVVGTAWGPCGGTLMGLGGDGRYRVISSFGVDEKTISALHTSNPRTWFRSGEVGFGKARDVLAVNLPGESENPGVGVPCWWSEILVGALHLTLHTRTQLPPATATVSNALALATFHLLLDEDDLVVTRS